MRNSVFINAEELHSEQFIKYFIFMNISSGSPTNILQYISSEKLKDFFLIYIVTHSNPLTLLFSFVYPFLRSLCAICILSLIRWKITRTFSEVIRSKNSCMYKFISFSSSLFLYESNHKTFTFQIYDLYACFN